jgi:hypothetical protein
MAASRSGRVEKEPAAPTGQKTVDDDHSIRAEAARLTREDVWRQESVGMERRVP